MGAVCFVTHLTDRRWWNSTCWPRNGGFSVLDKKTPHRSVGVSPGWAGQWERALEGPHRALGAQPWRLGPGHACTARAGEGSQAGNRAGWWAAWEPGEQWQRVVVGKGCWPLGKCQHHRRRPHERDASSWNVMARATCLLGGKIKEGDPWGGCPKPEAVGWLVAVPAPSSGLQHSAMLLGPPQSGRRFSGTGWTCLLTQMAWCPSLSPAAPGYPW